MLDGMRDIIVFQCLVNISAQDFHVHSKFLYRETSLPEAEQASDPQDGENHLEVTLVDENMKPVVFDGLGWRSWVLGIFTKTCGWLVGLKSLDGWLWWHWIVLLAGC